jgi:fermentation-respiration switch protein FrsA (DUF1100 family)
MPEPIDIRVERISFPSDGVELVGVLRLPASDRPVPAVAITGPFTGVKDQVAGVYADRLARTGIATLAFDHRGFGESGGRRGHEDSQGKLADLRAAVGVLASRAEVNPDRVGLVGVCLGGGYAVRAAAADPRVRAVAGIAGAYNSPAWFAQQVGIDSYRSALGSFLERYDEYLPAVAPAGGAAAMGGDEPYAYYGTSRSASRHWDNQVTRGSLYTLMTFDALGAARLLGATPLLVVHGKVDNYCQPELAAELHAQATGAKEMVWLDCGQHIDLYDVEPYVSQAVEVSADFLRRRL